MKNGMKKRRSSIIQLYLSDTDVNSEAAELLRSSAPWWHIVIRRQYSCQNSGLLLAIPMSFLRPHRAVVPAEAGGWLGFFSTEYCR